MTKNKKCLSIVCFIWGLAAVIPQKAYTWENSADKKEKQVFTDGRGTVYEKRGNVVYSNTGVQYIISGANVSDSRGNNYTIVGRNVMDEKGNTKCIIYNSGLVDCRDK